MVCRRRSWFSLEQVRDSFSCPRCLNSCPAVGNVDTATWSGCEYRMEVRAHLSCLWKLCRAVAPMIGVLPCTPQCSPLVRYAVKKRLTLRAAYFDAEKRCSKSYGFSNFVNRHTPPVSQEICSGPPVLPRFLARVASLSEGAAESTPLDR